MRGSSGSMKGRFRSMPVYGFSIVQIKGPKYCMICMVFWTKASEPSRSRGVLAVVRAQEYSVQGGLA